MPLHNTKTLNVHAENTWHLLQNHALSLQQVRRQIQNGFLPMLETTPTGCTVCSKSKFCKQYKKSLTNAKALGHLYVATKGKIRTESKDRHNYFVTIVQKYSRFLFTAPFKARQKHRKLCSLLSRNLRSIQAQMGDHCISTAEKSFKKLALYFELMVWKCLPPQPTILRHTGWLSVIMECSSLSLVLHCFKLIYHLVTGTMP